MSDSRPRFVSLTPDYKLPDVVVEAVQDLLSTAVRAGANITTTYDDVAGTLTIASTATSTGGGGTGVADTVDTLGGTGATGRAVMKAADATTARQAIGAGTGSSNLSIGTTGLTAKAGNWTPAAADLPAAALFIAVKDATNGWPAARPCRTDQSCLLFGADPAPAWYIAGLDPRFTP